MDALKILNEEIKVLKQDIKTALLHIEHNERVRDLEGVSFWAEILKAKRAALAIKKGV